MDTEASVILYVGGLSPSTTEDDIIVAVGNLGVGPVLGVALPRSLDSGQCLGHGFVTLASSGAMAVAQTLRQVGGVATDRA